MMNISLLVLGCLMLIYSCNGSMEEIVGELQRELQQLKMKTTSYENKIQHLENSALSSANKIHTLEQEVKTFKNERSTGSKELKRRYLLDNYPLAEKAAFSASLTNHATGLGKFQAIIFDNVFTNDLGAYSGFTGIFTAPENGTYYFTATVMSHIADYLETEICLNGNTLVYMYSYDNKHEQGTNSVVLALKAGDKVWVRHRNNEGSNAYGGHFSSFSGFMI